jgi:hypothetical protein
VTWAQQWEKAGRQVADCIYLAAKYTLPWWGKSIAEFPTPLVPPVEALYATHECSMKYRLGGVLTFAPARHVLTNYPEIGPVNLCAKVGDNEVGRWGVHPYDVRAHFWASQMAFWESRALVNPALVKDYLGVSFLAFDRLSIIDQLVLLMLPRAVGIGCTRGLLGRAKRRSYYGSAAHPCDAIRNYLSDPNADTSAFDGAQTTEVVRLRFAWCYRMVTEGADKLAAKAMPNWQWPVKVSFPMPKPADLPVLPKDFMANMKVYSNIARREGPTPTGPWPV